MSWLPVLCLSAALAATTGAPKPPVRAPAKPALVDSTQVVLKLPWGSGPGQAGRLEANESNPEGPMSFVVDEAGLVYLLDQVNSRIQVFQNGKYLRQVPIPATTFHDLVRDDAGGFVLLDRLVTSSLAFVDPLGDLHHEVPVDGTHIEMPGLVSALFKRADGYWVEYEHDYLVRVADAQGRPDARRPRMEGRPSIDGKRIFQSARDLPNKAWLLTAAPGGARPVPTLSLSFPHMLWTIVGLEPGPKGVVHLAAQLIVESPQPPYDVTHAEVQLVTISADNKEIRRQTAPAPGRPEEVLRPVRIGDDGNVYYLAPEEDGVVLRRFAR